MGSVDAGTLSPNTSHASAGGNGGSAITLDTAVEPEGANFLVGQR